MRSFCVLLLLALIAIPVFAIEKTNSRPKQTQVSASETSKPEEAQQLSVRPKLKLNFGADNNVCYTMHTLQVARDPGSDSTRLVRQRTCTPSAQFQMKSTVQRGK